MFEQGEAEGSFELRDQAADARLRHPKDFCRPRNRSSFHDSGEHFDLTAVQVGFAPRTDASLLLHSFLKRILKMTTGVASAVGRSECVAP